MTSEKVRLLCRIALSAALLAVCSWIQIPLPSIPVTMQTFAVFVVAALLPLHGAAAAVGVYLLLGAVGLPVFAGFGSGVGAILAPAGGYLIGFLPMALTQSLLQRRLKQPLAMAAGLAVCYFFGTLWYSIVYSGGGFLAVLSVCVLPYIIPDAVKLALAALLVRRIARHTAAH